MKMVVESETITRTATDVAPAEIVRLETLRALVCWSGCFDMVLMVLGGACRSFVVVRLVAFTVARADVLTAIDAESR